MQSRSARHLQLVIIVITIIAALITGYTITSFLGGASGTSAEVFQTLPDQTTLALITTEAAGSASPAATVGSAPVATEESTEQPAPTVTIEADDPGATAEASSSAEAQPLVFIDESFDAPSTGWPEQASDRWSAGYTDGAYQLTLSGQTSIGLNARTPPDLVDYRIGVDVAIEAGGAGLVFLFAEPAISYRIILSTDGAYSIELQDGDTVTPVVDWTASDALVGVPGATNRLSFERQDGVVRFFANDQPLTEFQVPEGDWTTRYGFVLTARSGEGQATFDNLLGERLPS